MPSKHQRTTTAASPERNPQWMVIWEFIVHLLVGTVIFAVVAAGVVGMELLRSRLGIFAAGSFIASVLPMKRAKSSSI